ncbi:MAG TPA: hypothetical protein VM328_06155 [Fimbriimonadaceae bacterium]|nr:hypothetical protein [Fimbriimonadaceae bacterium]
MLVLAAIVAIGVAGFVLGRQAISTPETITKFEQVPPKGAGKWGP